VHAVVAGRDLGQEFARELAPAVGHVRLAHLLEVDVALLQLEGVALGLQVDGVGGAAAGVEEAVRLVAAHVEEHLRIDAEVLGHQHGIAIDLAATADDRSEVEDVIEDHDVQTVLLLEVLWILVQFAQHIAQIGLQEEHTFILP
jgi:hypothetical protein